MIDFNLISNITDVEKFNDTIQTILIEKQKPFFRFKYNDYVVFLLEDYYISKDFRAWTRPLILKIRDFHLGFLVYQIKNSARLLKEK